MKLEPFLYVSNLHNSMEFYREILGFDMGDTYPDEYNPTFVPMFVDGHKLMLQEVEGELPTYHKHRVCGSGIQLFFEVPNVDEVYKRLSQSAQVVDQIADRPWGRTFSITDPDGYIISFYCSL